MKTFAFIISDPNSGQIVEDQLVDMETVQAADEDAARALIVEWAVDSLQVTEEDFGDEGTLNIDVREVSGINPTSAEEAPHS